MQLSVQYLTQAAIKLSSAGVKLLTRVCVMCYLEKKIDRLIIQPVICNCLAGTLNERQETCATDHRAQNG